VWCDCIDPITVPNRVGQRFQLSALQSLRLSLSPPTKEGSRISGSILATVCRVSLFIDGVFLLGRSSKVKN
jgi:hypothetical protein